MGEKIRLDTLVHQQQQIESREKARALIMSGVVYINNQKCDKPGMKYPASSVVEIRGNTLKYVSRGGLKLEKALESFSVDLKDKICMDVGASTGGFTDCMLQNGAGRVYAVDVGYGQLDFKLRNNKRVVNLEKTNIKYLSKEVIPEPIDFISMDVSFISIRLCLPNAVKFLGDNGKVVCLIKPQFEVGKGKTNRGVVKNKNIHIEVIKKICEFLSNNNFAILGLDFSPIKGPKGNIEYLVYIQKGTKNTLVSANDIINDIINVVEIAHRSLNGGTNIAV